MRFPKDDALENIVKVNGQRRAVDLGCPGCLVEIVRGSHLVPTMRTVLHCNGYGTLSLPNPIKPKQLAHTYYFQLVSLGVNVSNSATWDEIPSGRTL